MYQTPLSDRKCVFMIVPLVHDPVFLAIPSRKATKSDKQIAMNLLDTLSFHKVSCVGMAANMIGCAVQIIAFDHAGEYEIMYNPEILMKFGAYEAEESCLSLLGAPRKTTRYQSIQVRFQNAAFQTETRIYTGFTAEIIQHEIDHLNGILI